MGPQPWAQAHPALQRLQLLHQAPAAVSGAGQGQASAGLMELPPSAQMPPSAQIPPSTQLASSTIPPSTIPPSTQMPPSAQTPPSAIPPSAAAAAAAKPDAQDGLV